MILLKQWMLREARQFVIEHKGIFMKAIVAFADILPEPTKENTVRHNTHVLIDLRDKFLRYDTIANRTKLYEAAWKIFIAEYEHDADETYRFDWLVEELANSDWETRPIGHPATNWQEPDPYGGGYLIKDDTLLKHKRRFNLLLSEELK